MTRSLLDEYGNPCNLRDAIDADESYEILAKAEVYPSRIFFDGMTGWHPVAGADTIGIMQDPMMQDIEISPLENILTTFWSDGSWLVYSREGAATTCTTSRHTTVKPGVIGSHIYLYNGTHVFRYSIDWDKIKIYDNTAFTGEGNPVHLDDVVAVHAISDTESVSFIDDDGGFRVVYIDGDQDWSSYSRFMFPSLVEYDKSTYTMAELGIASGAARLGDKIFAYISNASTGFVEGIYYDTITGVWSDIFVAIPTDLDISQCSIKISNVYERNDMIYMCGQFERIDSLAGGNIYTLLMYSSDGKTFSLDRFVLVSSLGYRFLARVGPYGTPTVFTGDYVSTESYDDGYTWDGMSTITLGAGFLKMGNNGQSYDAGIRFRDINIPAGAIITDAYISFHAYRSDESDDVHVIISAEDDPGPFAFSTYADFHGRPRLAPTVPWTISHWPPGAKHTVEYDTPDLTAVIQAVVDQGGWHNGGDAVIFLEDDGSTNTAQRNAASWDNGDVPTLHVEWNPGNPPLALYLGNSNRVCHSPLTWVFDGINGTDSMVINIPMDDIKSIRDSNLSKLSLTLRAGREEYFDGSYVMREARVVLKVGMRSKTIPPARLQEKDDYVVYGTYIIDNIEYSLGVGSMGTVVNATNEAEWKLSGLSMPFVAEILGKSCHYDPLIETSTELSPAGSVYLSHDRFQVDFWKHEPLESAAHFVTGIKMMYDGGVEYYSSLSEPHKYGIITKDTIADLLFLDENPLITDTTVRVYVHGWSHPAAAGDNDLISIVLVTEDDTDEKTETYHWSEDIVPPENGQWTNTWPPGSPGIGSIEFNISGLTIGHRIKKIGVTFECATSTWFNIARAYFTEGVEVHYNFVDGDSSWTMNDDNTFSLPKSGRPFIMYSQRPYNAQVFSISASFSSSITGGIIPNYPVGCGVVGFGSDNSNYILARYNIGDDLVELIKCRNGVETSLYSDTPSFTINADHEIKLDYKGGIFTVSMWDDVEECFIENFSYSWQVTDGYMFVNRLEIMKCGIYGCISAPYARILGYYGSNSETVINSDGLAIDPAFDMAGFPPAGGNLRIGDDVYSYASQIDQPARPYGPYQALRNGVFSPPWGNGTSAVDCRGFSWADDPTKFNGYLIAVGSGYNFLCSAADWDVNPGDGMSYARMRLYSATNAQIGKIPITRADKVWAVGGFLTLVQTNTTTVASKHAEGEIATYDIAGSLKCNWFMGAGGDDDTVITDMLDKTCRLCGVIPSFPGDTIVSQVILANSTYQIASVPYADGLDVSFDTDDPNDLELLINIQIDPTNDEHKDDIAVYDPVTKEITHQDTQLLMTIALEGVMSFRCTITSMDSGTIVYSQIYPATTNITQKIRVLYFSDHISLYQNGRWIFTKSFDSLQYCIYAPYRLSLTAHGTLTMDNVHVKDLSDWREAIYLDLETDGQSAINSIIQQRLIEIYCKPDGSIEFYYEIIRDVIDAVREPRSYRYTYSVPLDGASDAIIYGPLDVKTIQNNDFAKLLGFCTRVFRLPDLTVGANRAVYYILKKSLEGYLRHDFSIRPDLELLIGDIYHIHYTTAGTGRNEYHNTIVEGISLNISMSNKVSSSMQITGRELIISREER